MQIGLRAKPALAPQHFSSGTGPRHWNFLKITLFAKLLHHHHHLYLFAYTKAVPTIHAVNMIQCLLNLLAVVLCTRSKGKCAEFERDKTEQVADVDSIETRKHA